MLKHRKMQYDKAGPRVAEALNKRYFEAYYCSDREEGLKKVLELIPGEHTVSWGGTMTVDELGIKDAGAARPLLTATPPGIPGSAGRCSSRLLPATPSS